jgi:DNA-binding response OmpR family regulator
MKILIAEDDPTNQTIARIWLSRKGHSVTVVPDTPIIAITASALVGDWDIF